MRAVKSTDSRKSAVVAAFKKLYACPKVTNVREGYKAFYADIWFKIPAPGKARGWKWGNAQRGVAVLSNAANCKLAKSETFV
mgnify:CR=1 FL=1